MASRKKTLIRERGRRDPERTRTALLSAARERFARGGFDGATSDAVANAAGVNKAMINYHFGGKRGLYEAVLLSDLDTAAGPLDEVRRSTAPARDRLERFIAVFARLHLDRPDLSVLLLRELLDGGSRLDAEVLPRFVAFFETLREIIEQGVREGTFRQVDPFLTHQALIGSLLFFFASRGFRERVIGEAKVPVATIPDPNEFIDHVRDVVVRGLAKDQPRGPLTGARP